ncbi:PhnA domain-containing protein [Glaciecola petra]|uniref:PhnA domain-containing protein n=1 Tax=Glaciecola petra TaxID=3075602 RepID=A0ABU2ZW37_9ALTE|nr:PhnA domain-containing protein [Aestuariibacter sp. P117]MDT0596228.1 PhnA domain-containing protein [Aestuariibacter sp. P117]
MSIQSLLLTRSDGNCELCQSAPSENMFLVPESTQTDLNSHLHLCNSCLQNIERGPQHDMQYWRFLSVSIWSTLAPAQVMSYRLLHQCAAESWAQDLLDIAYLEEDLQQWADAGLSELKEATLDANGVSLKAGDAVTIIKDLDVKGANFTAKRGTAVRNIGLSENPLHIEGKVNGQRIVLIAAYTKKN